ncbi:hypothetical protein TCAP_05873, partial [Tolypocladium capitatum]
MDGGQDVNLGDMDVEADLHSALNGFA